MSPKNIQTLFGGAELAYSVLILGYGTGSFPGITCGRGVLLTTHTPF